MRECDKCGKVFDSWGENYCPACKEIIRIKIKEQDEIDAANSEHSEGVAERRQAARGW